MNRAEALEEILHTSRRTRKTLQVGFRSMGTANEAAKAAWQFAVSHPDYPTPLAGNPYRGDPVLRHVHRLFMAYLRSIQTYSDRVDSFRDPPHPWENPTEHQKRCYYRENGWQSRTSRAERDALICQQKWTQAVYHLDSDRLAFYSRIIATWRAGGRRLPHDPLPPTNAGWGNYCTATYTPQDPGSFPTYRNARERRAARGVKRA